MTASGNFPLNSGVHIFATHSVLAPGSPLAETSASLASLAGASAAEPVSHSARPAEPFILLGLTSEHALLHGLKHSLSGKLPHNGLGEEGFAIEATPTHLLITADHAAGLFYAVRSLTASHPASIPCGVTADWPELRWRGIHMLFSTRATLPDVERMITEFLPDRRMNELIIEVNYNYQYKSHPEIGNPQGLTFDDCRHLHNLAHKSFVRLVPMINCLGHQSWSHETYALLKTHPDFDETPNAPADNSTLYCRSWCPSNDEVYKVVDSLADELIDAFQADAFHVGMDEVFEIGKCPRCAGHPTSELFARAVNMLHDHLVGKRHVEMMMWGDRLLDGKATGYGEWEASENSTYFAIDLIPKDIIMCDWHYENQEQFPSVKLFPEKGFRVYPSGWNHSANVRRLAAFSLANQNPHLYGYLATTWTTFDRILAPYTPGAPGTTEERRGDIHAAIDLGAQAAWTGKVAD
jgi:hypothetical protein